MKAEDIERLKSICEENGFEIKSESQSGLIYYIDKKDPWDGVEFAESLHDLDWGDGKFTKGKIYRVKKVCKITITLMFDDNNNPINASSNKFFQPSTESEYVEQLKKEAFERFGEIKDGDRFDCSFWGGNKPAKYYRSANKWRYEKKHDMLTLDHFCLYNSGKWATKLPERVKVEFVTSFCFDGKFEVHFRTMDLNHNQSISSGEFLAKQLEKYLNDNQE